MGGPRPCRNTSKTHSASSVAFRPFLERLEDRTLLSNGLDANQAYVQALYHDDLGRNGSSADLSFWTGVLQSSGQASVAQGIEHSQEARTHFVQGLYVEFLGRQPANGEEQGFVNSLIKGNSTEDQVASAILASDEFFQRGPSVDGVPGIAASNTLYVEALFNELLQRAGNVTDVNQYVNNDLPRLGRQGVVLEFFGSVEFRNLQTRAFYGSDPQLGVLHRNTTPTGAEVGFWVNSGKSLAQVHLEFESSREKFNLGRQQFDANDGLIQDLYQSALGRTASAGELDFWEQTLLTGGFANVVTGINHSAEARTHLVRDWFVTVLGRSAGTGETQPFVAALGAGASQEHVLALILGSQEFYNRAPSLIAGLVATPSDQTFVQGLFELLLGRAASAQEAASFTAHPLQATSRIAIAEGILQSTEYRGDVVQSFYTQLLQRGNPPTQAEVNFWVSTHQSLAGVQDAFESSPEFRGVQTHFVTLGDSLTDEYAHWTGSLNPNTGLPFWGSAGDQNWVEQLRALRGVELSVQNEALAGETSSSLLTENQHSTSAGQQTAAAQLIHAGTVNYAVLIIGANDIAAYLQAALGQLQHGNPAPDPAPFIATLMTNLTTTLDALSAAGTVHIVLGNIPDIGQTPQLHGLLGNNPGIYQLITTVTSAANQQIEGLAAMRNIPVVDLFRLGSTIAGTFTIGGMQPPQVYAPDGFHPGTVAQGLLANAVLEAAHEAYGLRTANLSLTDQEILADAGIGHTSGPTYFDVSAFVTANRPGTAAPLALFNVA